MFTHELVRHRAGSAFSQESLRYVRLADIGFRVPPALEPVREQVLSIVEQLEEFQVSAAAELGIDAEGVPFHVKKEVTSALRRLAPIGLSTDIVWTANARTLRHVIEMRTAEGAEEELRLVFDTIARIMQAEAPGLFQDFARGDDGSGCPSTARSSHLSLRESRESMGKQIKDAGSVACYARERPRTQRCAAQRLPVRRPSCACAMRRARGTPPPRSQPPAERSPRSL